MPDPTPTTPREERKLANRLWRAVPFQLRRDVLRSAKAGHRHPDDGAATAAERYATALLRTEGTRWWNRTLAASPRTVVALSAGCCLLLLATVVLIAAPGPAGAAEWFGLGWAVLGSLFALLLLDARRDCRRLLAVVPALGAPHRLDVPGGR